MTTTIRTRRAPHPRMCPRHTPLVAALVTAALGVLHAATLLAADPEPAPAAPGNAAHPSAAAAPSPAPTPVPCRSPEHRQFDFWLGAWDVTGPKGKLVGSNRIESIRGGCALQENWQGRGGSTGTSLNFYDPADRHWHQTWVGNDGTVLFLVGGLDADGHMVLSYDPPVAPGSAPVRHRITWSRLDGVRVRQHWETSGDQGHTWTTAFDGTYAKHTP